MGRSTNLVTNPAVKTFKWKNEKFDKKYKSVTQEAGWYYWDKTAGEDGEGSNIALKTPARFMWLESMQSVSGFSEKHDTGVYSNEVPGSPDSIKEYGKQTLVVKINTDIVASGTWKEISEEVKGMGGKYCIAVYGAMQNEDGEFEVVRFLFTGSSRDPWMNLADRSKLLKNAVVVSKEFNEVEMKTGATYQAPILSIEKATQEELNAADALASNVEAYFKFTFDTTIEKEVVNDVPADSVESDY